MAYWLHFHLICFRHFNNCTKHSFYTLSSIGKKGFFKQSIRENKVQFLLKSKFDGDIKESFFKMPQRNFLGINYSTKCVPIKVKEVPILCRVNSLTVRILFCKEQIQLLGFESQWRLRHNSACSWHLTCAIFLIHAWK